ncbi:hypothetical protein BDY19DRAFT_888071 [Irpex rosettiformis]|uniref:Uncharacterized protein n=1 Tax=Irpex rosettiformis TaxID=378272 RepID=A0ACB8U807_9APHY|nr:hypothetical protein BDY19DRAFT_888071 [Irpex rosettiformis]
MSRPGYVIKPKEPTVLAGQSEYVLDGNDLMISTRVDTSHIVPGPIDLERFNDALARTLSVFPTHAGRLQRPSDGKGHWKASIYYILLTNDGVPVTVVERDDRTEVPSDSIVQSPWTLTNGVNIVKYLDYGLTEPVMNVTIIRFTKTGSTSIGLSAMHFMGDGFVILHFARTLSQYYQGLELLDPPPSYNHERVSLESVDTTAYAGMPFPGVKHVYSMRETMPHNKPGRIVPVQLTLRIEGSQIKQAHAVAQAQIREKDPTAFLSRQDVLVALLVYSLSHAEPDISPIQSITSLTRGMASTPSHTIGNALLWIPTEPARDFVSETIATIALRVRQSLAKARDPGYITAFNAVHAQKLEAIGNAELGRDLIMRPGDMVINSTWKFDWTSAHFGYPGQTRFYHTLINGPRFVKFFRPNPTLLPDGTWKPSSPDDVEINLFLPNEVKERFKEIISQEVKNLGVVGSIDFIE